MRTENIKIENLYLDPNNPRFIKDFIREPRPDSEVKGLQVDILKKFVTRKPEGEEEGDDGFYDIREVHNSIKKRGFVPIDKPIVRLLKGEKEKYLVVEGNRRTASVKKILKDKTDREELEANGLLTSLEALPVKIVETEGRSDEEVQAEIDQLLAMRHHESLLEWDNVPLAHHMFNEYLSLDPKMNEAEFKYIPKRAKEMASVYGYKDDDVRKKLRTYVAMRQLDEEWNFPVKPKHWSILQNTVCNEQLKVHLLKINESTLRLDDESCVKINDWLQFELRERKDQKKVVLLKNPSAVNKLARIYEATASEEKPVRDKAKTLLAQLKEGKLKENGMLVIGIEDAISYLKRTELQLVWLKNFTEHLNKLDEKEALKIDNYNGTGNAKSLVDEITSTNSFKSLKKLF